MLIAIGVHGYPWRRCCHLFLIIGRCCVLYILSLSFTDTLAMCYFPAAYQGEYVTQAIMSAVPTISYSKLTVQFDSIPIWGVCHRRIGNNVILVDEIPGGGENGNSYSGTRCFKCFNLVLRSANVLQIHTSGLDKVIDFYGILLAIAKSY